MKINLRWMKIFLLCLVCFGLGIMACWSVLAHFNLKATRLFYYQAKHPYEKDFSKEDMAKLDSLTVVFRQIMYHIRNSYYRDISLEEIATDLFKRQNEALDIHTSYLTRKEAVSMDERLYNKNFGGIGISMTGVIVDSIDKRKTRVLIDEVFSKSPAEKAGVLKRDTIAVVDGKKVFLSEEAKNLIRGPIGTKVLLGILRKGFSDTVWTAIERGNIVIPTVTWSLVGDKKIGLIKIYSFSKLEPGFLRLALSILKISGAKEFIIDLRNNGGGFVNSFFGSCPFFLVDNDTIAVEISRNPIVVYNSSYVAEEFGDKDIGRFKNHRIVCLVNKGTASAAEFFAKTMQRWGYVLVGETTFGKSHAQHVFSLVDGSVINVSFQRTYFGGNREEIPDTGIVPDVLIKNSVNSEKDLQLEKAIEILQKGGGG